MEMVKLVAILSPHTGQEEQVRKDVQTLGRVLPMVSESVEMMEGVRDEVAMELQRKERSNERERKEKEKLMRAIEREIGLRAIHNS